MNQKEKTAYENGASNQKFIHSLEIGELKEKLSKCENLNFFLYVCFAFMIIPYTIGITVLMKFWFALMGV